MSSRDNLKQLMKKQQLLFDALDSKPPFNDRQNRLDIPKKETSSMMSKVLNNSGLSYQPNDNSNLQGSFRVKSPDMSQERLNNSYKGNLNLNMNQDFSKTGMDFMKKVPSSKINQDLYNQLMKNKYQPQNDVARVQKFINDIFSSDKQQKPLNSTYNSPFKNDQNRQRTCISPTGNESMNVQMNRSPDENDIRKQQQQQRTQLNPELIRKRQSPYNNTSFNNKTNQMQYSFKDKKSPNNQKFSEPPRSPTPKSSNNPILNNFLSSSKGSSPKIQHFFAQDLRGRPPTNVSPDRENEQSLRRMSPSPPPLPNDQFDYKRGSGQNLILQQNKSNKSQNEEDNNIPNSLKNIYNHIHSKIDNRMKVSNDKDVSPSKLPTLDSSQKGLKQRLLEEYLTTHTKHNIGRDPIVDQSRKRVQNQTNPPQQPPPTAKALKPELEINRPKTEGNAPKLASKPNRTDSFQCKKNDKPTEKESSLSTTLNHESKTDEKMTKSKSREQYEEKSEKQDSLDITLKRAPAVAPANLQRLIAEMQVQKIIQQEEYVYTVLAVVTNQHKALKLCKCYLNLVQEINMDPIQYIYQDRETQRILIKCLLVERIGLIVVLHEALSQQEEFDENSNNIKNLLLYIHNNQLLILEILSEKLIDVPDKKKLIEQRLKHLQNNKKITKIKSTQERINLMKKNNNIITSILTLIIENPLKEVYQDLDRLIKGSEQLSLQQGSLVIIDRYQKILTQLHQLRLSQESHLTDQTFDDDNQEEQQPSPEQPVSPFLPPASDKEYTLVVDLDETLVHYQELHDGGQFLVRPYAEQFLYELSRYYEIVIFTAAIKEYADFILDVLDTNRQHTSPGRESNTSFKDLSKLGRDLSKTLIVDNLPENFQEQPENGIYIQTWMGETEDRALYDLAPLLKQIVKKKVPDVRIALRRFRDNMLENIEKGVSDPHLNLTLE